MCYDFHEVIYTIVIIQILLPDNVTERYWHSLSSFIISPTSVLLVVFGGCRESVLDIIRDTHVIELGEYTQFHTFSVV